MKCFSLNDLDLLTNTTTLPIIMSAGCSTAHFAPLPPYEAYVDVAGAEHAGTDLVHDPEPAERGRRWRTRRRISRQRSTLLSQGSHRC